MMQKDSPITAAGLTLVEFSCPECGHRWWEEEKAVYEGVLGCLHGLKKRRRTDYITRIRLSDF